MPIATLAATEADQLHCDRELPAYLDKLWLAHFADVPRANEVQIGYCYPWKSRLGLIRISLDHATTFIGINTLLQHPQVPESVLITTIAHEMAHYVHGFGSPLPRRYKHPHANGVIDKELEQRNLGHHLRNCNEWIDKHWYSFYDMHRAFAWTRTPRPKHASGPRIGTS